MRQKIYTNMIFTRKIYLCTDYNKQINSYALIYFFFLKKKEAKIGSVFT